MTLAGTRPPTVDEWEKYELHHRSRMSTKPGITGMWQVSGRSDITDFEEVVRLDTEYIEHWTIEILDEPLYYYDLREGSLSQSYKSGLDKKFTVLYTTLLEWIHEHNYTRVEKYASLMYVWRIFGCFSLEYKETSIHSLVEGRDNVKRMISTNEFRKAIKDAIKCNCGFKKNIFLLIVQMRLPSVCFCA